MRLLLILIALPAFSWAQTQVITLDFVLQGTNSLFVPTPIGQQFQSYKVSVFDYSEPSYKSYDILVGQWNHAGTIIPASQHPMIPSGRVFNYTLPLSSDYSKEREISPFFKTFIKQLQDDKDPN